MIRFSFMLLLLGCSSLMRAELRKDEQIVFYPVEAILNNDLWSARVHGKVFENETDSLMRHALISSLHPETATPEESANFERRSRLFLVDNQGYKGVRIQIAGQTVDLKSSASNGHFEDSVSISDASMKSGLRNGALSFDAVLPQGDARLFRGTVHPVPAGAVIVVSDIDDTTKISDVRNKNELLKNTFLRPFRPAPGMPEFYRNLASRGAFFFYVSASPWQLYPELRAFGAMSGYPEGVFRMKYFRLKDSDFLNLFQKPFEYKTSTIEPIIQSLPGHSFILIGDSGEKDPEAYAGLAAKYPEQVKRVLIRIAYEDEKERMDALARKLAPGVFQTFRTPSAALLPAQLAGTSEPGRPAD
jgi:phosphatidate phosphatase APP1